MTDIGEGIAVGMLKEAKGDCFFCKEKPKSKNPVTDEHASPDTSNAEIEDLVPENDHHNDASKLGENLGGKPEWLINKPESNGEKTTVLAAAHHLIPGNASFMKVKKLIDYLKKDGPHALETDVGYSINHENNGIWLPGNYNVRAGKENYTTTWSCQKPSFKNAYAVSAIRASRSQFHDAHSTYNRKVRTTLEKLLKKIGRPSDKCPFCGEKYEKVRPPYGLVGRLDFISRQHRGMLSGLTKKTSRKVAAIRQGYFTSSKVKAFFGI